ncbi:MAG: formate dehydrogenase accessory sulfurtransferase FdhD [Ilumatobacteraceae bacterium]|jgi:FdhD protein
MTQARRKSTDWKVLAVSREGRLGSKPDYLVTEEPMEVRVAPPGTSAETVSVTMRTPGHDFELAVGFLFTEGIIATPSDLRTVKYCELDLPEQLYNIVTVEVARPFEDALARRAMVTSASCGICGTESIDQLLTCTTPVGADEGPRLTAEVLLGVAEAVRKSQPTFDRTGGLHASALFNDRGEITIVREDIGRHNAVDKVIGQAVMNKQVPLTKFGLFCSGRLSFEIIQKAAMARIAMIAAVGAPSSLAVETAEKLGITVVGFLRDGKANVYTQPQRVLV